jgi:tetrahydromethanopterin S-methyltransferase subunit C
MGAILGGWGLSSGIKTSDTAADRFAKILPADVTAAFMSIRAGLDALGESEATTKALVVCFFVILFLCPFYFRILMDVKSVLQNAFLCVSFVIFGLSIANHDFAKYLGPDWDFTVTVAAIALPVVWAFIISPMFLKVFGNKLAVGPG